MPNVLSPLTGDNEICMWLRETIQTLAVLNCSGIESDTLNKKGCDWDPICMYKYVTSNVLFLCTAKSLGGTGATFWVLPSLYWKRLI